MAASDKATIAVAAISAGLALVSAVLCALIAMRQARQIAGAQTFDVTSARFSEWQNHKRSVYSELSHALNAHIENRNSSTRAVLLDRVVDAQIVSYPSLRPTLTNIYENPDRLEREKVSGIGGELNEDAEMTPFEAKQKLMSQRAAQR
ncbi:hypothetical protein [Streptomyces sp. 1331.2]|uniref:hypothetical protein n=1 Tax=Streptomyces sp. 1331.2 TaxID=1938835 RepID=UPI00117DE336|nr:hypothetical protein [Streptomyces sp. 1331.2]